MSQILEKDIEKLIEDSLIDNGYRQTKSEEFDKKYCLNKTDMIKFLEKTQSELLEEFKSSRPQNWQDKLLDLISSDIKRKGLIKVLREGVEDFCLSTNLKLVYFKPNNKKNKETVEKYEKNRFSITRQLYFEKTAKTSIDLVLFLNGLPIVIMELKNKYTGQNTKEAEKQFRLDRSYKNTLTQFNQRALIYFALDNDEVSMATELKGKDTFFLPFNKGFENGAGNPIVEGKLKTHYLWEEILLKDSLLDIFRNFYFIQEDTKTDKKIAIFPRFHQLDVVKSLEKTVKEEKSGHKYLIQHSAGSGKTNSISWLAHRLSKLHDEEENPIFDSVLVLTDRKVLDKQLQDAIYQLDKTRGIVVKIDKNKTSKDLARALKKGSKIIITTIQKFSHAYKELDKLDKKKYAIIIDEAHSSTSGENMNYLKLSLAGKTLKEAKELEKQYDETSEDRLNKIIDAITNTGHLSFFAFTATPKDKTMQIFGKKGEDGKPHEFHLYSMRQAIEEGFILDPLRNYMVSDTYFKIGKKIKDNPEFEKTAANKAIGAFVNLHEYNIDQKVETIVEDFMANRQTWLKGKAKAMIVTSSRLHALKYKLSMDKYLASNYPNIKSLIAFSGELEIDEEKYTEESVNHIKESELPEVFDGVNEVKFLIVADKYQTGFDQPKLCAMYVDKMLNGVTAVQTLSRLNRVTKGKDNTFVLDFVNEVDTIRDSFARYYTASNIQKVTDPNIVFEFYHKIDEFHICYQEQISEYCKLYFKEDRDSLAIANMDNLINIAIERFLKIEDENKQEEFKTYVIKYFRSYNFLMQIYPFRKISLYEMYIYLGSLIKKFPKDNTFTKLELDELLSLDFYKLKRMNGTKTKGEDISLEKGDEKDLKGFSDGGTRKKEKVEEDLDSLIQRINDLFGYDLSEEDRLAFYDQPLQALMANEELKDIATVNNYDEFETQVRKDFFLKTIVSKKSVNEEMFHKIFTDSSFKSYLIETMSKELYHHFNA
ncbi:type I restriction endonuclease subunit R [Arcobacter sp. YIC-80]|uniref:type I restriction endonuclease subunit R n=1 Tax=Arcobacter sp. YIC-80 TaxID=3376683 RepID=UPI00384B9887